MIRATPNSHIGNARILIADNERPTLQLLERTLRSAGYSNLKTTSSFRRLGSLQTEHQPDLIILGLGVTPSTQLPAGVLPEPTTPDHSRAPLLVLLAEATRSAKEEAILLGARDFIAKPVDPMEAVLRIRNLLEMRFCNQQLQAQNEALEARVHERTAELEEAQFEVLERLALAAEYRDDSTGQHTRRVGQLSALVARNLGFPGTQVGLIRRAAPLHDVGKIGIPDHILLKAGKLTETEYRQMKAHTFIGARILSESRFPLLEEAEEIALTHHERWDGTGYPRRLKGDAIPLPGRIVAVADVFDALTHHRPYKQAWTVDAAITEIVSQRGRQFDPKVVDAFLRVLTHENLTRMELGATV